MIIMEYTKDQETGRIIYFDDTVDIGKEPLPIPEENRWYHEKVHQEVMEKYFRKQAPTR